MQKEFVTPERPPSSCAILVDRDHVMLAYVRMPKEPTCRAIIE
jgi:hypothetical protein